MIMQPSKEEIAAVFRERFGIGLEQGLRRLEELADDAIFFDNWLSKRDGQGFGDPFGIGTKVGSRGVRMDDRDFAILAFFAGVGRLVMLELIPAQALPDPDRFRAPDTDGPPGRVKGRTS